jgi:DNA repair protein RadC
MKPEILSSQHAFDFLRPKISRDVEEFWVLALTAGKRLIAARMMFRGTVDRCEVHPRDIFRFACLTNASSVLIAHNHPHGDPTPSQEDLLLTTRLVELSSLMEIPILDHLILTDKNGYTSLFEYGRMSGRCEPILQLSEL